MKKVLVLEDAKVTRPIAGLFQRKPYPLLERANGILD